MRRRLATLVVAGLAACDPTPRAPAELGAAAQVPPRSATPRPAPPRPVPARHAHAPDDPVPAAIAPDALVPAAIAPTRPAPAEPEPPWPPSPARAEPFELTFVGDVILGRYRETGFDPIPEGAHELFGEVGALLESNLVVGNLETPLAYTLPAQSPVGTRYSFGADPELAAHLAHGGFDVLSLANNHAYDLRGEGVEQTPRILAALGITAVGAARADAPPVRVETVERDGWRIGFIAVTTRANIPALEGVPPLPLVEQSELADRVGPLVQDARVSHDLVVVLTHWGDEYADEPAWEQQQMAHALVEAGADLVIGHHPHVLQGIERHGHGLVAYSLGNFLFENVKDVPRMTGVLRVRYSAAGCLDAAVFHPAFIKSIPIKYPAPATGYMGQQIKERLITLSRRFGTRLGERGDDLEVEGTGCPSRSATAPGPR